MLRRSLGESYNPLYFLAALGAGGLSVSFFVYLMFMVPHPDTPMVTFNHLWPILTGDRLLPAGLVAGAIVGMLVFGYFHLRLLWWNLSEYRQFRRTAAFETLRRSNAEISLMAIPLTLAMTINVLFALGAALVPNLWQIVEYLFPFALAGFLAVGVYAMRILGAYFVRLFVHAQFDFSKNNSLAPMVAIFALSMIAVGLAAPGAMSANPAINATGIAFSVFFATVAILLMLVKLVLGFDAMLRHGVREEAAGSLWIMIPIMTLLGITYVRLIHGLDHGFGDPVNPAGMFVVMAAVLSVQVLFGLIGYAVMKELGYFRDYVNGDKANAGAFALICPGVAFFVFGVFFVTFALLGNGLVEKFSVAYFLFLLPFVLVQIKTIQVFFKLRRRLLVAEPAGRVATAG
ncbi:MAG: TsoY family (seleno)protein [Halothiobacillaceae bacterium]